MTGALSVRGVSVRYGVAARWGRSHVTAVDDVSFDVAPGRILALVGESGCGKSSIARSIVGLNQISAGGIHVGDAPLGRHRRASDRLAVQMIFQNPRASLNPRRTVRDALLEALVIAARRRKVDPERELGELLSSVALPEAVLDRRPDALSGGQCQRVAIARALALRPRFLLADEATAALDATVAAGTVRLFRKLADTYGLGVLLITHDLRTVEWIADEVAVMYLGRIVEHGTAAEVLDRPRHPYTACLIDARPSLHGPQAARVQLRGDVDDSAGEGCRFAPRCPRAAERCRTTRPPLTATAHRLACHFPLDELRSDPVRVVEPDLEESNAYRGVGS